MPLGRAVCPSLFFKIMYNYNRFFKGSLNPGHLFDTFEFNKAFRAAHPEYFDPDGILVFCGAQGQGKTISAVSYVERLCLTYPDVVVCTNIQLNDTGQLHFCVAEEQARAVELRDWCRMYDDSRLHIAMVPYDSVDRLTTVSNGYAGVLYVIDEMHLEFNSLESKQMNSQIFYQVSQQRKQRKHIVGTSQVFSRLAKPFREQFRYAVNCRCYFRCIQRNALVDALKAYEDPNGDIVAPTAKVFWWFHQRRLYEMYDTTQLITRTRGEF